MDMKSVRQLVSDYDALVERAINVTNDAPYYASADHDDNVRLSFDGDDIVLSWKEYESDYYGGGYLRDEETRYPIAALLMSDEELAAFRAKVKKDERERQAKLRRAEEAVARERAEARDRAEFARLSRKYVK